MKLVNIKGKSLDYAKALYLEAFPPEERKPFDLMLRKRESGNMELFAVEDRGRYAGLAFTILYKDILLLDYFAIDSALRGQGYGSQTLKLLHEHYGDRRFMLEIESTTEKCPDHENRVRRKRFYTSCGMSSSDFQVVYYGIQMEIMSFGKKVSYSEYHDLLESTFGAENASNIRLFE